MWDTVWILGPGWGPVRILHTIVDLGYVLKYRERRDTVGLRVSRNTVQSAIGAVKIGLPCETLPSAGLDADN